MHQAPLTPAVCVDTLGVSHPPFPAHAVLFPRTISLLEHENQESKPKEERRCSNVVIDPTQKNEALPPLSL